MPQTIFAHGYDVSNAKHPAAKFRLDQLEVFTSIGILHKITAESVDWQLEKYQAVLYL
jgi:hypothetical protein